MIVQTLVILKFLVQVSKLRHLGLDEVDFFFQKKKKRHCETGMTLRNNKESSLIYLYFLGVECGERKTREISIASLQAITVLQ